MTTTASMLVFLAYGAVAALVIVFFCWLSQKWFRSPRFKLLVIGSLVFEAGLPLGMLLLYRIPTIHYLGGAEFFLFAGGMFGMFLLALLGFGVKENFGRGWGH